MKWLALFALASFVVLASGCTSISFLIANAASLAGQYERSANHAYGPESRQRLDVYSPKVAKIGRSWSFSTAVRGPWGGEGFTALSERRSRSGEW